MESLLSRPCQRSIEVKSHRRCHTAPSLSLLVAWTLYETKDKDTNTFSPPCRVSSGVSSEESSSFPTKLKLKLKLKRSQSDCSLLDLNLSPLNLLDQHLLHQPLSTMESTMGTATKSGEEALAVAVALPSSLPALPEDLLPLLLECIQEKQWKQVLHYLEEDPSLTRREVSMVCEGENSKCLLVHLLCGRRHTPISVFDTLVTLHPGALLLPEQRGGRLPIHLAVIKGASLEVIHYLCQARPQALHKADQELNYPLHYAAMYGSPSSVRLLVQAYPQACRVPNGRDRLPLHLLCARCFDTDTVTPEDLQLVLEAYPEAAQKCDRFGRMPLHLASQVQHQQWALLDTLIRHYPEALVHKDMSKKTPLVLAKSSSSSTRNPNSNSHDLVVTCLAECTLRERRKQNPYLPPFLLMTTTPRKHHPKKNRKNVDLYNCYG